MRLSKYLLVAFITLCCLLYQFWQLKNRPYSLDPVIKSQKLDLTYDSTNIDIVIINFRYPFESDIIRTIEYADLLGAKVI